jgi:hypothetical protein
MRVYDREGSVVGATAVCPETFWRLYRRTCWSLPQKHYRLYVAKPGSRPLHYLRTIATMLCPIGKAARRRCEYPPPGWPATTRDRHPVPAARTHLER